MRKLALMLFAAVLAAGFTACEDDNNGGAATETVSGFYTINGGNMSGNIPASITAYDYASETSTDKLDDAFFAANGIALGDGAQQAIVHKGKMYIVMYRSNLIWVVDPVTLDIITSIRPQGDAVSPRAIVAKGNRLYCSMYTGYVIEIDADTDEITRTVKVGPNPDGIAIAGNMLVVANTDGQNSRNNYADNSISVIDLDTFTQTEIRNTKFPGNHPTEAASNGTDAFVVMQGSYKKPSDADYVPGIIVKVAGKTEADIKKVCDGTAITVEGNELYVIDAPYYGEASDRSYRKYDVNTFADKGSVIRQEAGTESEVIFPNGLGVDPVSGDIVVLSYYGQKMTKDPCYANIYDRTGNFKKRIECGVGARYVTFVRTR